MSAAPAPLAEPDALELLTRGRITVEGRMAAASNATLYAAVEHAGVSAHCIYKPVAGERPLWDFPHGTLGRREVAAYAVSVATGWEVVPPTVWREGPFGAGSVQLWVDAVELETDLVDIVPAGKVPPGWLPVLDAEDARGGDVTLIHADDDRLARMAVFDAVIDNADRKGGHVLAGADGQVWGVDHGLSFNLVDKLRTVLWGWQGEPLPDDAVDVLRALASDLDGRSTLFDALCELLSEAEVARTRQRVGTLLRKGTFPRPRHGGPVIPWPPF
ncbi:MAG TPA: SCO1664 family protein [Actinomycetales bacterium]|nr:SCO1664 family protein [Actinomycetales bacterium]